MQDLVRSAMAEGAVGVASALVYAPGFYADTDELVALARAAAEHDGMYISHLRSEGHGFLDALDELLTVAREARVRAEIYHLKASGEANWHKLDDVVAQVEEARADGLAVTADMYPYTAGATGLNGAMPPWVQEGGFEAWRARLADSAIRERVEREMTTETDGWENMFLLAGPENMRLLAFRSEALQPLTGKTLAEVASQRGTNPVQTAMDLVGLLHDVGGERAARARAPVGELLLRLSRARCRRPVPPLEHAPADVRRVRAGPRQVRARRAHRPARGSDPAALVAPGGEPSARRPGAAPARLLRRRRRLRS
jgi:N-acyl-D-aspartate/D-glutamate deacylase